jgi:hypothetical protein
MNQTRLQSLLILSLCLYISAAPAAHADNITGIIRTQDPRLEQRASLSEPHTCLGEVLEHLSRQTGIDITIDGKEVASGQEVTVECKGMPVAEILNSLWSLVSSQGIEWAWVRTGKPDSYGYKLVEPEAAKSKTARFRELAQELFERYVATMIQLAEMSPEQRKRNKHEITKALFLKNDDLANALVKDEGTWIDIRLFAEALSPEIQLQVLRGDRDYEIAVDDLSEPARNLYQQFWESVNIRHVSPTGAEVKEPLPKTLHISSTRAGYDMITKYTAPQVEIQMGETGRLTMFASAFMTDAVYRLIAEKWRVEGDAADSAASARKVEDPGLTLPLIPLPPRESLAGVHPPTTQLPDALQWRFRQLAQGAGVPLFAVFPLYQTDRMGSPIHHTIREYLAMKLLDPLLPITKWRGNTLLVNYPAWFTEEDNWIPYRLVKQYLDHKDGLLPLPELVVFLDQINDGQAEYALHRYPLLRSVMALRPLVKLFPRFAELLSSEGMPLDAEKLSRLRSLNRFARSPGLSRGTPVALRLVQQTDASQKTRLVIQAEVLVGENDWEPLCVCTEDARIVAESTFH